MKGSPRSLLAGLSILAVCAVVAIPVAALAGADSRAEVRLSLTGGGEPRAGEEERYRFSVRNTGRVALESVRVSTRLPRSLEYRRGGRFRSSTRTVTFTLGRLAPGRVRSRVLVARVAESFRSGRRIELESRVSARPVAGD